MRRGARRRGSTCASRTPRRPAAGQGLYELGQTFRGVLTVAVQQRDEIKTLFDRVVEADLLVAAIALVDRVGQPPSRGTARCRRHRPRHGSMMRLEPRPSARRRLARLRSAQHCRVFVVQVLAIDERRQPWPLSRRTGGSVPPAPVPRHLAVPRDGADQPGQPGLWRQPEDRLPLRDRTGF